MPFTSKKRSIGMINHIKGYLEYLIASVVLIFGAYAINTLLLSNDMYIAGLPTNTNQFFLLIKFAIIGCFLMEFILPFLDIYYEKPITSLFAFLVEHGIYSTFLCILCLHVYNFSFYPALIENYASFFILVTLPVFGHELGHFIFAYKKRYNPVLIPFRLVDNYIKEDNPTEQTLALTVFHGNNSNLISAAGPLMNLTMCFIGIYLSLSNSFSKNTELVLIVFIMYNGLLFFYNIGELLVDE